MLSLFVSPQILSRPECFLAEIAWKRDPLQVVCLNVVTYVPGVAFFSTNIANSCCCHLPSTLNPVLTFMHHRFDLLVKLMHVGRNNGF